MQLYKKEVAKVDDWFKDIKIEWNDEKKKVDTPKTEEDQIFGSSSSFDEASDDNASIMSK